MSCIVSNMLPKGKKKLSGVYLGKPFLLASLDGLARTPACKERI